MVQPPVMRWSGLSPSQEEKCLALGYLVMSVPIPLITFGGSTPVGGKIVR